MTFDNTIKLNLDRRGYTEKPKDLVGIIRVRLCRAESIRDLTLDQLMGAIQRGYTFTPAAMTGTKGDTWQSQQVICADIDNDSGKKDSDGNKIMLNPPLLPDEAMAVMADHGITPCFMYYTFSSTDAWPKYRIVLVLEHPLTNRVDADRLTAGFAGIFNAARPGCADTAIRDNARLLYGGRAGCVFYVSREATSTETLRALPAPEVPAQAAAAPAQEGQQRVHGPRGDLRDAIETFDLAAYVSATEDVREVWKGSKRFFVPCPLCKTGGLTNGGSFNVTGHQWHCFSDNHEGLKRGGSIIDYLMIRHHIDLPAAMSMFENQIIRPTADEDFASVEASEAVNTGDPDSAAQLAPESAGAAETGAQATTEAEDQQPQKQNDGIGNYILNVMPSEIATFGSGTTRTGFTYLDEKSSGGLFPGLYAIGAISSLGKTTLIHQMADQMAANGQDVLFFSLEQSRLELASKSLARMTAKVDYGSALTSLEIRRGVTRQGEAARFLPNCITDYTRTVGDHLNVIEGGFRYTVEKLCDYVLQYMEDHQTGPVVIVDYLQILNTDKKLSTRRDEIDHIVSMLKILSAKLNIPVIVISSVNRANYLTPVDFESFKESGGIEYTADVVWGLQLACLEDKLFDKGSITEKRERIKRAKGSTPREVQLVCLKNRYGITDWKVDFKYYPQFDLFKEISGTAEGDFAAAEREAAAEAWQAAEDKKKEERAKRAYAKMLLDAYTMLYNYDPLS